MKLWGKSLEETMEELNIDIPDRAKTPVSQNVSDVLCTRDSYFHSCWTRLKFLRPDLIQAMGEVELFVAGYETSTDEENEEDKEEEDGIIL